MSSRTTRAGTLAAAKIGAAAVAAVALAALIGAAPAGAKTKTRSYSSGPINTPIPDGSFPLPGGGGVGTAVHDLRVKKKGKVKDVNVSIRISHSYDRDLELWLMSPARTIVKLALRRGGVGDDYGSGPGDCTGMHTVFDDQAPTALADARAPFAGSFRPDQPLSVLHGSQAKGTWSLFAVDSAAPDTGMLHCWGMTIGSKSKRKK
jgi:subtilisin-like proprotein convertase family protein